MSTGGRVFPSITGGGLSEATRAILDAQLAKRGRELQSRQLDITEADNAAARALQSRQIDIADRAQALNQLTTLSSFLPPGSRLGDLGTGGMGIFTRAFGISADGLEDLELNPETFASALDAKRLGFVDSPEFEALLLPSTRSALGLEPSADVAATRDLEAQMRFNALNEILTDPELTSEFTARALGRDPVKVQIPGTPGEIAFESVTAANIYAQFLLSREQNSFRLELEGKDPETELVAEIKKAVELAGQSVSSVALQRVFGVYNRAIETEDVNVLSSFVNDPGVSEGEKLAVQFLVGSIRAGEETFLQSLPRELANFLQLQEMIDATDLSDGQKERMKISITEALDPNFILQLRNPVLGRLRLERGGVPVGRENPLGFNTSGGAASGGQGTGDGGVGGLDVSDDEILQAFELGDTREQLISRLGADRVNSVLPQESLNPAGAAAIAIPAGGINPDSAPAPFRRDVQQLNTLLRRLETTQGEAARRNIQTTIDRLRTRIQAGMRP